MARARRRVDEGEDLPRTFGLGKEIGELAAPFAEARGVLLAHHDDRHLGGADGFVKMDIEASAYRKFARGELARRSVDDDPLPACAHGDDLRAVVEVGGGQIVRRIHYVEIISVVRTFLVIRLVHDPPLHIISYGLYHKIR